MKNDDKQLVIGIDLGGTSIKYAVVTTEGEILWQDTRPTKADSPREEVIENIIDCIITAKSTIKQAGSPVCVGMGTPGLVDIENGIVLGGAPQLPGWDSLPLAKMITEATDLPTFIDNDANMMGLGEYIFGSKQKGKNLIFFTIGTGIGGAIIINSDLYRGYRYAGSELGCILMNYEGKTAYWEEFASTSNMIRRYVAKANISNPDSVDGKIIVQRFTEGEKIAVEVINEHTRLVGEGIAGFVNIFNPEQIVIGGGISESGDFYIEKIRSVVEKHAMKDCYEGIEISAARLGNKAGFLGASHFAFTQLNKTKS